MKTELDKVKENLTQEAPAFNLEASLSNAMPKVYLWMTLALVISGLAAWTVANTPNYLEALFSFETGEIKPLFWGLIITEVVLVLAISAMIHRISPFVATLLFIAYAVVNGITLSSIFVVYNLSTISTVFFITAGMFAAMAVVGYTTKKDLSGMGRFFMMALIGIIIATVVSLILGSTGLSMIICYAGVVIFAGLTAYDVQKIKEWLLAAEGDEILTQKIGILGALSLYLDFINIFLYLLRIFGRRD